MPYIHKLTISDLFEISRLIKEGSMKKKDIAKKYNFTPCSISKFFTKYGELTDESLLIIKKQLLRRSAFKKEILKTKKN